MYNEPYLETCCRSALHRVTLSGGSGRPDGMKDGPCLHRLAAMGFVCERPDGRFETTGPGRARHSSEIERRRAA